MTWIRGRLKSGPYAGPIWGAEIGTAFLCILPGKTPAGAKQYEVLFADLVLGEKPTLKAAQKFAEETLGGYMDRLALGLRRLSGTHDLEARRDAA